MERLAGTCRERLCYHSWLKVFQIDRPVNISEPVWVWNLNT